jgi:hypothetical protein
MALRSVSNLPRLERFQPTPQLALSLVATALPVLLGLVCVALAVVTFGFGLIPLLPACVAMGVLVLAGAGALVGGLRNYFATRAVEPNIAKDEATPHKKLDKILEQAGHIELATWENSSTDTSIVERLQRRNTDDMNLPLFVLLNTTSGNHLEMLNFLDNLSSQDLTNVLLQQDKIGRIVPTTTEMANSTGQLKMLDLVARLENADLERALCQRPPNGRNMMQQIAMTAMEDIVTRLVKIVKRLPLENRQRIMVALPKQDRQNPCAVRAWEKFVNRCTADDPSEIVIRKGGLPAARLPSHSDAEPPWSPALGRLTNTVARSGTVAP